MPATPDEIPAHQQITMLEQHRVNEVDFSAVSLHVTKNGIELSGVLHDAIKQIQMGDLRDVQNAQALALWVLGGTSPQPHARPKAAELLRELAQRPGFHEAKYNLAQYLVWRHQQVTNQARRPSVDSTPDKGPAKVFGERLAFDLSEFDYGLQYQGEHISKALALLQSILEDCQTRTPAPWRPDHWLERCAVVLLAELTATGCGNSDIANPVRAIELYTMAAQSGHSDAAYCAGVLLEQIDDLTQAAQMYELALSLGHQEAQTNLGILHYACKIPDANPDRGLKLLKQASLDGDRVAQMAIVAISQARINWFDRQQKGGNSIF